LTAGESADIGGDVSADGKKLVFRSNRGGSTDLWLTELPAGTPKELTATPDFESVPKISSDGSQVAFSVIRQGRRILYVVASSGGSPRHVCADCGPPQGWSPDQTKLLYVKNEPAPASIYQLDIASGESRPMVQHKENPVYVCQFSPDGRWLVFKSDLGTLRTRVFVAPVPTEGAVPPESWIPITEGDTWDDLPRWSRDARTIYFFSHRDGFRCIWARGFDPAAGRPAGAVFEVEHFHQISLSLSNLSLAEFEFAVAPDRLVFPLAEISGNIWMITPDPAAVTR
jgi:Tol biopolymer transport system component